MPASLYPRGLSPRQDTVILSDYIDSQWHNPSDILSILLILGPEIVQKAVAQLAGRVVTPVAFSFGWVAYAINALLATVGGRSSFVVTRLLSSDTHPDP